MATWILTLITLSITILSFIATDANDLRASAMTPETGVTSIITTSDLGTESVLPSTDRSNQIGGSNKDNHNTTISGYDYLRILYEKLSPVRYNPLSRPLYNQSQQMVLDVILRLFQVISIDDVLQQMATHCGFLVVWKDELLPWDRAQFGGIWRLIADDQSIWKPTLSLYNSMDNTDYLREISKTPTRVFHDGTVIWAFDAVLKTSCILNMDKYPFDVQTCSIVICPSIEMDTEMNFTLSQNKIDLSLLDVNYGWEIINTKVSVERKQVFKYAVAVAKYEVTLKRRPTYVITTTIAPNMALAFLNCFVFLVSSDSGEKISFGTSVLLSLTVSLISTSDNLPSATDGIPAIVQYHGMLMANSILAVILTIINSLLQQSRGSHDHPKEQETPKIGEGPGVQLPSPTPVVSRINFPNLLGFVFVIGCWCASTVWYCLHVLY